MKNHEEKIKELEEQYKVLGEKIEELKLEKTDKDEILEYANSLYTYPEHIYWEGNYLKIPLPSSHTEWTFHVWDIVKKLVEKYDNGKMGCYPIHYYHLNNADYQYVEFVFYD